jgi:hypothetical protein
VTRQKVLAEFDALIARVEDPDSRESWSEADTSKSLRQLRAKVDAELLNALRVYPVDSRIDPKPGERWG